MVPNSGNGFKHDLTSVGDEYNCPMVRTFFGTTLLGNWDEDWPFFQSCGHCGVFQICWCNEFETLMASSFRDLNSFAGISLHPLALLTAVFLKAHLTSHFRLSGSGWLTTSPWLSTSLRFFLYSSSVYSLYLVLISSTSARFLPLLSFIVPIFGEMFPWYFQFSWRNLPSFPFCCFPLFLCIVHQRSKLFIFRSKYVETRNLG